MREGLDAPTFELPAENVAAIRAFLDGQSRIKLAVWVRHEHDGPDGSSHDHHVVLAVADEDWATGDMRALDAGLHLPLQTPEPTWIDIAPVSEVEPLRSFGRLLWEHTSPGPDPLDFRFTHEPVAVSPEARSAFGRLVRVVAPEVVRVSATRSRLWKGESEVEDDTNLSVGCYFDQLSPPGPLGVVQEAAREAGIAHSGASLERPAEPPPYATILYERGADR
ncbi:MAG TPA: hypothetical protein VFU64_10020 [Gaiellaceae bacterium]|nr:hypothetical protein [Gaiellaceae bacterium]